MALGTIPPWLDTRPADFTAAAEVGGRLGLEAAGQQQQAQQEAARLGQQQMAQRQQVGLTEEAQALEAERQAAAQAEAQQRLQLETQTAARKFQAQQGYQQAIRSGADPIRAMMQFGPEMGESMAGLGPLSLAQTRLQQATMPPQPVVGPDGNPVGYTYANQMHMLPRQPMPKATLPPKMSQLDQMDAKHAYDELAAVNKAESANASIGIDSTNANSVSSAARALQNRREQAKSKLNALRKKYGEEPESEEIKYDKKPSSAPEIGDVEQGYKFLGGDPADQNNWEKVSE